MKPWIAWLSGVAHGALLTVLFAIVVTTCSGCSTDVDIPATPGIELGEAYCAAYHAPCGHVYEFLATADNELGHVELCVLDEDLADAERAWGPSMLSTHPRFNDGNLCLLRCDGGKGCNALSGCWGCQ